MNPRLIEMPAIRKASASRNQRERGLFAGDAARSPTGPDEFLAPNGVPSDDLTDRV